MMWNVTSMNTPWNQIQKSCGSPRKSSVVCFAQVSQACQRLVRIVLDICAHTLSQPYLGIALILTRYAFGSSDSRFPNIQALCTSHHLIRSKAKSFISFTQIKLNSRGVIMTCVSVLRIAERMLWSCHGRTGSDKHALHTGLRKTNRAPRAFHRRV
jgi:hypothetical protein